MAKELSALYQIHTWDLVPLPQGKQPIGSHQVCKIKTKFDGSIEIYNVKLIAKGYFHEYSVDYEEKFALVAKMTTFCTLIVVASSCKWKIF